ncbi:MAG: 1,4-dihydroxy-6-naphthoate synthase [Pirellulaceae bacterium]|nr:1,4-dihydroxy-6-naphthoate synthase [Pirellulaceae bacterium]
MTTIRLGISTCPNDTFAFHGLMTRQVDWQGLHFEVELLDIQQLNDRLMLGDFNVAKASFHAALFLADQTLILPSGSALGIGVGPLLLSAQPEMQPSSPKQITLCPGKLTTAALLFSLFYSQTTTIEHTVFSDIMPRLRARTADFGVCIHEGRFTFQKEGLNLVEDLGTRWEQETHCPLPLGGILARRSLGPDLLQKIQLVIQDSIKLAIAEPELTLPTMRHYAQSFDDEVLMKHVKLYVNEWTVHLGELGRDALQELSRRAAATGLIHPRSRALEILEC